MNRRIVSVASAGLIVCLSGCVTASGPKSGHFAAKSPPPKDPCAPPKESHWGENVGMVLFAPVTPLLLALTYYQYLEIGKMNQREGEASDKLKHQKVQATPHPRRPAKTDSAS